MAPVVLSIHTEEGKNEKSSNVSYNRMWCCNIIKDNILNVASRIYGCNDGSGKL